MNEMASQVIGGAVSQLQVLDIYSFLRSCHAYMEIWTPVMGEILVVKIEPMNRHDIHVVAIYRDAEIVGHVPYNIAPRMSAFPYEREQSICRNHRTQSQQGNWLWSGSPMCLPSIYMNLMFMLTK